MNKEIIEFAEKVFVSFVVHFYLRKLKMIFIFIALSLHLRAIILKCCNNLLIER